MATVHDRRATHLPINAMVRTVVVDDPIEVGAKLSVLASVRDDPLAHLHDRHWIDDAEFAAGRRWQHAYDTAGIGGVRAIDTTLEPVDGRRFVAPMSDLQMDAIRFLGEMARVLGQEGDALVRDILGKGWVLSQCAMARGLDQREGQRYLGRRIRECLNSMAKELGLADPRS